MNNPSVLPQFAAALKKAAKVDVWSPTDAQLGHIARQLAKSSSVSPGSVQDLVAADIPNVRFRLDEGLDMSDLKTLLALAKKISGAPGALLGKD